MKKRLAIIMLATICLSGCGSATNSSAVSQAQSLIQDVTNDKPAQADTSNRSNINNQPTVAPGTYTNDFDFTVQDQSIPGGSMDINVDTQQHILTIIETHFSSAIDAGPSASEPMTVQFTDTEWDVFMQVYNEYTVNKNNWLEQDMYYCLSRLCRTVDDSEETKTDILQYTLEAFEESKATAQEMQDKEDEEKAQEQAVLDQVEELKHHKVTNIELYLWEDFFWDNMDTLSFITFTPTSDGAQMTYKCYGITEDTGEKCFSS